MLSQIRRRIERVFHLFFFARSVSDKEYGHIYGKEDGNALEKARTKITVLHVHVYIVWTCAVSLKNDIVYNQISESTQIIQSLGLLAFISILGKSYKKTLSKQAEISRFFRSGSQMTSTCKPQGGITRPKARRCELQFERSNDILCNRNIVKATV